MIAKTSLALVTFLAEEMENFSGSVLLEELLVDIASQLDEVLRQAHNPFACFLSPLKIETTLSQTYFLMVGRLTHSSKGFKMLEKGDILQRFFDIVTQVQHESYSKLIVASLSYREEYPKRILAAALSSSFDHSRLFTTQFLRVLVRDKLSGFSKWGMELLVNQLGDKNRSISLTAMDILEEAIHDKVDKIGFHFYV
jgi:rapamycin-insensitive companion of mTOR